MFGASVAYEARKGHPPNITAAIGYTRHRVGTQTIPRLECLGWFSRINTVTKLAEIIAGIADVFF
ncbi:hypothetical protein KBA01_27390 [Kozakia baliensis]|nr:hypothetical protein KBA01_27390 [Kozakia baliensis]